MTRLTALAAAAVIALVMSSAAFAGIYAGPRAWSPGEGAGTSFSTSWLANAFGTYGSGYDKLVTFIDNKQYAWHNTVRNTRDWTETYPPWPQTAAYKGHCRANSWFHGSCFIR